MGIKSILETFPHFFRTLASQMISKVATYHLRYEKDQNDQICRAPLLVLGGSVQAID